MLQFDHIRSAGRFQRLAIERLLFGRAQALFDIVAQSLVDILLMYCVDEPGGVTIPPGNALRRRSIAPGTGQQGVICPTPGEKVGPAHRLSVTWNQRTARSPCDLAERLCPALRARSIQKRNKADDQI